MSAIRFSGFGLIIRLKQKGGRLDQLSSVAVALNTVPGQKQFAYKMLEIAKNCRYRGNYRGAEKIATGGSQHQLKKEKAMVKWVDHLKKEWKVYVVGIWMIGVTGFLFSLNGHVQVLKQNEIKLSSDVDSIESILISTDGNVAEVKKQVGDISSKVKTIHKRVMRR
jgi:hypothetical protein